MQEEFELEHNKSVSVECRATCRRLLSVAPLHSPLLYTTRNSRTSFSYLLHSTHQTFYTFYLPHSLRLNIPALLVFIHYVLYQALYLLLLLSALIYPQEVSLSSNYSKPLLNPYRLLLIFNPYPTCSRPVTQQGLIFRPRGLVFDCKDYIFEKCRDSCGILNFSLFNTTVKFMVSWFLCSETFF